jgi:hypothetical protein
MIHADLPLCYVKEIDPVENVVYYNTKSFTVQHRHPFIDKYQKMLLDFVE